MEYDEERAQDAGTLRWQFERLLEALAGEIAADIAGDHHAYGRFTRAYLRTIPRVLAYFAPSRDWEEACIDGIWTAWLARQLVQHVDDDPNLLVVHYAVHGLLAEAMVGRQSSCLEDVLAQLGRMTWRKPSASD